MSSGHRRWREWKLKNASAVRLKLIKLLGGKCAVCGKSYVPILQIDHIDGCTWNQRWLNRADRQFKYMKEYEAGINLRVLCISCNKKHLPQRSINNDCRRPGAKDCSSDVLHDDDTPF